MSMKSLCRTSLFALATTLTASAIFAADGVTSFKSVNVDLPFGDRMFEGTGADVVNNNCLACHSVGMVLTQPPLSRQTWEAEVAKMRNAYKAPIANEDVNPIVDYLSKLRK
jgi:cytochrome c5